MSGIKRKFILNPVSGSGKYLRKSGKLDKLKAFFTDKTGSFDLVVGESRADIELKTKEALLGGANQIVAMGGDGTVNAVVNGFMSLQQEESHGEFQGNASAREASLAIARLGSGSDFFRTVIRGAKQTNWCEIVLKHVVRRVDIGKIEFLNSNKKAVYFINMASSGMSAVIAREKENVPKWLPSSLSYVIPTVSQMIKYKTIPATIKADEVCLNMNLTSAFVAKGVYAGGGMKFGGAVSSDDGFFDITLVDKIAPLEMLLQVGKLYRGALGEVKGITKLKVKEITISSQTPLPLEFDGEAESHPEFRISLLNRMIPVCFPETEC